MTLARAATNLPIAYWLRSSRPEGSLDLASPSPRTKVTAATRTDEVALQQDSDTQTMDVEHAPPAAKSA